MSKRTKTEPRGPSAAAEYLTPREVAAMLNIPEGTLAVWRSTNRVVLPFFKLGGHVRYRRADLMVFIESQMRNGGEEA